MSLFTSFLSSRLTSDALLARSGRFLTPVASLLLTYRYRVSLVGQPAAALKPHIVSQEEEEEEEDEQEANIMFLVRQR